MLSSSVAGGSGSSMVVEGGEKGCDRWDPFWRDFSFQGQTQKRLCQSNYGSVQALHFGFGGKGRIWTRCGGCDEDLGESQLSLSGQVQFRVTITWGRQDRWMQRLYRGVGNFLAVVWWPWFLGLRRSAAGRGEEGLESGMGWFETRGPPLREEAKVTLAFLPRLPPPFPPSRAGQGLRSGTRPKPRSVSVLHESRKRFDTNGRAWCRRGD